MANFYTINELSTDIVDAKTTDVFHANSSYASKIIHDTSFNVNIYIKALSKVIEKLENSIELVRLMKNYNSQALKQDKKKKSLVILKAEFANNVFYAKRIIEEFAKAFVVVKQDDIESEKLAICIGDCFVLLGNSLDLFYALKDLKYADKALEITNKLQDIFKNMKNSLEDENLLS